MKLLVGCPVYERNWSLSAWAEAVKSEAEGHQLSFLFVVKDKDQSTINKLYEVCDGYSLFIETDSGENLNKHHKWVADDFFRMVRLRNHMLRKVRELQPDAFFSLDSDMILHKGSLAAMVECLKEYDAVGVSTSMVRGLWCESWMHFSAEQNIFGRMQENDLFEHAHPVGAIMGGKLMSPKAYACDYRWDPQGEDLGWARAMLEENNKVCVAGLGKVTHVMHQEDLVNSQ